MTDQRDTITFARRLADAHARTSGVNQTTETLDSLANALEAVVAERDALRDAIRNAPHGDTCPQRHIWEWWRDCTCAIGPWAKAALNGVYSGPVRAGGRVYWDDKVYVLDPEAAALAGTQEDRT